MDDEEHEYDILDQTSDKILEALENSSINKRYHGPILVFSIVRQAKKDRLSFKSLSDCISLMWSELDE